MTYRYPNAPSDFKFKTTNVSTSGKGFQLQLPEGVLSKMRGAEIVSITSNTNRLATQAEVAEANAILQTLQSSRPLAENIWISRLFDLPMEPPPASLVENVPTESVTCASNVRIDPFFLLSPPIISAIP